MVVFSVRLDDHLNDWRLWVWIFAGIAFPPVGLGLMIWFLWRLKKGDHFF